MGTWRGLELPVFRDAGRRAGDARLAGVPFCRRDFSCGSRNSVPENVRAPWQGELPGGERCAWRHGPALPRLFPRRRSPDGAGSQAGTRGTPSGRKRTDKKCSPHRIAGESHGQGRESDTGSQAFLSGAHGTDREDRTRHGPRILRSSFRRNETLCRVSGRNIGKTFAF